MNSNLMTLDNMMFAGTALAAPPATKPVPSENVTQFSQAPNNIYPSYYTPEPITTDNISTIVQNEYICKPRQDFKQALRKTVETESPKQNQKNNKPDKQYSTSESPSKANPAYSPPVPEIPNTLGTRVKENATKIEPKTGSQLAQMIADLKGDKSNPVTGQAAKSDEIKLLLTTDKGQLGIKTVLPNKSKGQSGLKNASLDSFSDKHKLQTSLSNISESISKTDTQSGNSKNNDKISDSNGTVVTAKAPTNVENAKELIPDVLSDTKGKKAVTNEKTSILGASVVTGSTKSPELNGKKADHNTLVDDSSKTAKEDATLTDKSVIHTNEKTPVLNTNFAQVQNKITGQDSQPIEIAPVKSKPNADGKTTNPEITLEPSNSNNKETPNTGSKLSGDSTVRDLNITNIQISINQTKNHNSSTHNKNQNSNFEQVLNHNNPATSVTELSSNSAEGTKTVELPAQTSPNNISADIGKQILESIQSSSSQEGRNQQITVQLNPPELGKVFIKFQEQDSHITGLLEVSKAQTRIEIEQAIPQIVRSLQDSGIQIKRLDVVLSQEEQPEQGALKEQTLQNGWARQQGSADSYTGGNNPDVSEINEWLINNNSYRNISELQESLTPNGSINMLI